MPAEFEKTLIDRTIKDMDLTLKADERTSGYSGGNKRKLSVALSMVANPTVNFLDVSGAAAKALEPSPPQRLTQAVAADRSRAPGWTRRRGGSCGACPGPDVSNVVHIA